MNANQSRGGASPLADATMLANRSPLRTSHRTPRRPRNSRHASSSAKPREAPITSTSALTAHCSEAAPGIGDT